MRHSISIAGLFLLSIFALAHMGCDSTVTTSLGSDRPFTLWGVLNVKSGVHAVRLFTIEDKLQSVSDAAVDATVTSTNLTTGEMRTWSDSVVTLDDGDFRHVFWEAFPLVAGHEYRIEATTSNGETSWGETRVPGPISLSVEDPDPQLVNNTEQIVHVSGDPPALPRVDLEYRVFGVNVEGISSQIVPISLTYESRAVRRLEGWDIAVDFARDFQAIWFHLEDNDIQNDFIQLFDLEMRVHVGDSNWISPVETFDPESLVEPGVFSNINNGFGFVGSGYVEKVEWRPPNYLLRRAGFETD